MEKKCESAHIFGSGLAGVCLMVAISKRDNRDLRPESISTEFDVNTVLPSHFRYGWLWVCGSIGINTMSANDLAHLLHGPLLER